MSWEYCPICGDNWYNADEYDRCYKCSMEEQGKELCHECGEKYYDPEKYDCCYECHKESQENEPIVFTSPPTP